MRKLQQLKFNRRNVTSNEKAFRKCNIVEKRRYFHLQLMSTKYSKLQIWLSQCNFVNNVRFLTSLHCPILHSFMAFWFTNPRNFICHFKRNKGLLETLSHSLSNSHLFHTSPSSTHVNEIGKNSDSDSACLSIRTTAPVKQPHFHSNNRILVNPNNQDCFS